MFNEIEKLASLGKVKNPFESLTKMNSIVEGIITPYAKTHSILDSALKSQMKSIAQISLRTQAFYEVFQPATLAFAKIHENSLTRIAADIEKTNSLYRSSLIHSISDVIGKIELPPSFKINDSILKQMDYLNNGLADQFKSLAATDLIKNLQAIPELKIPSHWEEKSFDEIIEEVSISDGTVENDKNLMPLLALLVAGLTGLDLSDLKNPDKRKMVLAQIFHFMFFLAIAQFNKDAVERTDYCVAARGCVVRTAPGYKAERLTAVPKNYTFRILEDSEGWYKVQFIDPALGFREGWVKKSVTSNMNDSKNSILFSDL